MDPIRILDQLETPIWLHDFARVGVIWANAAAVRFWNADSLEALIAREFRPLSEGARRQLEVLQRRVGAGERAEFSYTLFPDGEPTQVTMKVSPWTLDDGHEAMLIEVIAERSSAHEERDQRAVEALRHTRVMIGLYDLEGNALFANPAMELGFGADVPLTATFLHPGAAQPIIDQVMLDQAFSGRYRASTLAGRAWHMVTARAVTDPVTGHVMLLFIREDITERVRADGMKDDFISVVSHELRTPLTSIIGSLELVSSGVCGEVPTGLQQMLTIARRNSARLLRQVSDLLDLQKMVAGRLELQREVLCPHAVVRRTVEDCAGLQERHGVVFEIDDRGASEAVSAVKLFADETRVVQVLTNLLGNAAKFSPPGSAVRVGLTLDPVRARFSVADSGPGIPVEFRGRIFERFTQAEQQASRKAQGSGLGLFIAKSIVDAHGGTIGFTNTEGGTVFAFELPLAGRLPG